MKNRTFRLFTSFVLASVIGSIPAHVAVGQEPAHDSRYFERQAILAYRGKNFSEYLADLEKANELRPNHPRILYNLSGAYALNGKTEDALKTLSRLEQMRLDYPVEQDDDFASLKTLPLFQRILGGFAVNRQPVGPGQKAFSVPQTGLIAEGIAYDPVTRTFYVSSVHQRKIIQINAKGDPHDFATAADGLWGVFGMKVDAARRRLWVCTSTIGQMEGFDSARDKNQAALLEFDLRGKVPIKRYPLADRSASHVFGDLALAPNGDVYVSDSGKPAIYRLRSGAKELELFVTDPMFRNLQGLTFSPDARRMFVADYPNGIFMIDMASKRVKLIEPPEGQTLLGIDGIYFTSRGIVGIQNGVSPQRVIRLALDPAHLGFTSLEVLEANQPLHDDITLGVLDGSTLYYIGDGQWNAYDDNGKLDPKAVLKDVTVLRLPLLKAKPAANHAIR